MLCQKKKKRKKDTDEDYITTDSSRTAKEVTGQLDLKKNRFNGHNSTTDWEFEACGDNAQAAKDIEKNEKKIFSVRTHVNISHNRQWKIRIPAQNV